MPRKISDFIKTLYEYKAKLSEKSSLNFIYMKILQSRVQTMDRARSIWIQLNGVPAIAPQSGSLAYSEGALGVNQFSRLVQLPQRLA